MQTIQLPIDEYQKLQKEVELLKNTELLANLNTLLDLLYQQKYGFYMGEFTDDLAEAVIQEEWNSAASKWDNV